MAEALGLEGFTLVGHDVRGMVAYAYLREYDDAKRAVVVDTVVPGVDPWDQVLANPYLWHFAFHTVPALPEKLVQGHQTEYFAYFFDVLAASPASISAQFREEYAAAYRSDAALKAGFDFYRALSQDARDNRALASRGTPRTPMLYVRGGGRRGIDPQAYVAGFRAAGVEKLHLAVIPEVGHFIPEEAPQALWELIHS